MNQSDFENTIMNSVLNNRYISAAAFVALAVVLMLGVVIIVGGFGILVIGSAFLIAFGFANILSGVNYAISVVEIVAGCVGIYIAEYMYRLYTT